MTDWIRANWAFDDHSAVFTLSDRTRIARDLVASLSTAEPIALEAFLRIILLDARPELAGCVIYYMRYEPLRGCFEIGVSHDSLPRTVVGSEPIRIPLFEDDQKS